MDNFLIFKNLKKAEGSQQPDYNVMVNEDGKWVSWGAGWVKDGKNGKFISVRKSKPRPDMNSNGDIGF